MRKAIHDATAQICKDIKQPDLEIKEPEPFRRYARLLVIFAVGALLLAATVVLAMRTPKLQAEKRTVSSAHGVQQVLLEAALRNETVSCPCQIQTVSWCEITSFHVYVASKQNISAIGSTLNFTEDEGRTQIPFICDNPASEWRTDICQHVLSAVMNMKDSQTFLPTANVFTDSSLLYTEIATRLDTNMYEQSNSYTFLKVNNDTMDIYNYSQVLLQLIRNMATQFNDNSSSSAEDFWRVSEANRSAHMPISFGMNVSWDLYLSKCNAPFCDVQFPVSVLNRVLRAMAQVGGITTVISLALKFIIWPSFRIALRFPTDKPKPSPPVGLHVCNV